MRYLEKLNIEVFRALFFDDYCSQSYIPVSQA
jgi:hypothetical protein